MSQHASMTTHRPAAALVTRDPALFESLKEQLNPIAELRQVDAPLESALDPISPSSAEESAPHVVLVDGRSEAGGAANELVRRIRAAFPQTVALVLADSKDPDRILAALKSGAADYLIAPFEGENRVDNALSRALSRESGKSGELWAVTSGKGGQGVTTLAVNLADQLHALTGGNVLLADFKRQGGDIAVFLDTEDAYSLADLKKDLPRLDGDFLFSALHRHENGFYVLFAPESVEQGGQIRPEDIGRMIAVFRERMDRIIVDLPLDFHDVATTVIDTADRILLVTQQTVPSARNAAMVLDLFREVGFGPDKVRVVVNRFSAKSDIPLRDMAAVLGQAVFATVGNDFPTVNAAVNKGRLLSAEHGDSVAGKDISKLARMLSGGDLGAGAKRSASFLKKLRRMVLGKKEKRSDLAENRLIAKK